MQLHKVQHVTKLARKVKIATLRELADSALTKYALIDANHSSVMNQRFVDQHAQKALNAKQLEIANFVSVELANTDA